MANASPQHPGRALLLWVGCKLASNKWIETALPIALMTLGPLVSWSPIAAIAITCLGILAQISVNAWGEHLRDLTDVREAQSVVLEQGLAPMLERLAGTFGESREMRQATAEAAAREVVIRLVGSFNDVPDVRAVVFEVQDADTMTVACHAGRQSTPSKFQRGTDRGDKAFAVLEKVDLPGRYVLVKDLAAVQPATWAGTGGGYSTFISAPITDGTSHSYGLLTVDSPAAGALTRDHASAVATFASLLAVHYASALAHGRKRGTVG